MRLLMVGRSRDNLRALSEGEKELRLAEARSGLEKAGAHYVTDTLDQLEPVLDAIDERLKGATSSLLRAHE